MNTHKDFLKGFNFCCSPLLTLQFYPLVQFWSLLKRNIVNMFYNLSKSDDVKQVYYIVIVPNFHFIWLGFCCCISLYDFKKSSHHKHVDCCAILRISKYSIKYWSLLAISISFFFLLSNLNNFFSLKCCVKYLIGINTVCKKSNLLTFDFDFLNFLGMNVKCLSIQKVTL